MSYNPIIKRFLDFVLALIALIVLSPLCLVIAIIIKVDSEGPILFKQKRLGKNKVEFYILKFRTMRTDSPKDMPTHMLQDPHVYITRVGKFLRKTSLDEVPQLINILRGDMSIVGPRPALWNQYDLIQERERYQVNDLYPGLTGWAQVNGRDELPIDIKATYDGEYARKISFAFDVKVVILTISAVIGSKGIKEGDTDSIKKITV